MLYLSDKFSRWLVCMAALVLFALRLPAGACLWYKGTTLEGGFTTTRGRLEENAAGALLGKTESYLHRPAEGGNYYAGMLSSAAGLMPGDFFQVYLRSPVNKHPDWPEGMDAAVQKMFEGDAAGARTALEALVQQSPENYYLCANLGVACELAGDLPAAMAWLEKSLAINPGAHGGTEWMHAAVIRARMALEKDAAWLDTHTISGIPRGVVPKGFTLRDGSRTLSLKDIHQSLVAHTLARLVFVKPKDAVAASLLTELAEVEARLFSIESGSAMLKLAERYGAANGAAVRAEWAARGPGPLKRWLEAQGMQSLIFYTLAVIAAVVLAGWWQFRRWRKRRHLLLRETVSAA
jgi:hypothetical protein